MSKLVDVKVELLDESCLNCPIILLESKQMIEDDFFEERKYVIHKCSHLDFCEQIYKQHFANKENK